MDASWGDRAFWDRVLGPDWERRGPYIVARMAKRIGVGVRDECEDVFQEALRRSFLWVERRGGPREVAPEETTKVLYGIVKNVLREKKRSDDRGGQADADAVDSLVTPRWLDEGELAKILERQLYPRLTARQRQVFELYSLNGVSQREVADRVGTSVPTVCREMQVVLGIFREILLGRPTDHEQPRAV